jgi:uracil-DNA glycosylase
MSYYQEIIDLFSKDFKCKNMLLRGKAVAFTCEKQSECKVNQKKEPIWSSGLGTESTEVMIVAEAPSKKGGLGANITGLVADWPNEEVVQALFRFVKEYYNTVPYFADLMKCGVYAQTKQAKKVFSIRKINCIEHFLIKEIAIVKPKTILCLGSVSYKALEDCKKLGQIKNDIKLVKLIHYGKQANLQLTSKDKEKLIWPFEAGKIDKNKMSELHYFNK